MAGALAVAALILGDPMAATAELPGVRLDAARSPGAEACPTAEDLARELRDRRAEAPRAPSETLYVSIQIEPRGDDFVATMQVSGRKRGIRSLSGRGPGCDALRETLLVSLLVLLDEEPDEPARTEAPLTLAPAAPNQPARPEGGLWLSAAGAGTHGLPDGFSGAVFVDLGVRFPLWEAGAGGFYAAPREIDFYDGKIAVSALGARARACLNLPLAQALQLSGCGQGAIASLGGEPTSGFSEPRSERRPWWLVGAGPELRFFVSDELALGVFGAILVTGRLESFSIEGLGPAYETDRFIGWLGVDAGVKIW